MADFRSLVPFGRTSLARGGQDPFASLQDEMNRLFEYFGQALPAPFARGKEGFIMPKVDVAETDAGLELTAELPGFEEKDVSLDIHEGVLTIKAEHKGEREEKDDKKKYHLVERTTGSFLRRLALPFEADAEKASAHLDKGLLKVTVPRLATPATKPTSIPIGSGKKD